MQPISRRPVFVALATLLGFALRLPMLGDVPPRWDEGWSVAHAALDPGEILTVTAADVHPPLYYLLLGAWQRLVDVDLFAVRYFSVLSSTTAIPLIYVAARAWAGSARAATLAAWFMAWLPLGVYYGAVARMYALAPSLVLLAAYGASRLGAEGEQSRRASIAFTLGAAAAMLTLYHAVWALAAVATYAFGRAIIRRDWRAARSLALSISVALLIFAPWGLFAVPQFLARAAAESATNIGQQFPLTYFLRQGVYDLTMSQQIGEAGLIVTGAIIAVGLIAAAARRASTIRLVLPALAIAFTLTGVAFAARQWAFNARMLICAAPALAMWLGWSFDQLLPGRAMPHAQCAMRSARCPSSLLPLLPGLALVIVYWPTSTEFVYAKTLEVFDPYNPHAYHQHIAPRARQGDLVFFNVLSPAGFYALDRRAHDPRWSYALTWDPVIEPRSRWEQRIGQAAEDHDRLWIVLYRGLAGANGDLRGWMDSNFYPAYAAWGEEEVFYGLYGVMREEMAAGAVAGARWGAIVLEEAQAPQSTAAGAVLPVRLTWRAEAPIAKNYKVFVHATRPDGFVIAQHDAQPLNDLRPMTSWTPGEPVRDNHGLALPADHRGVLQIKVGLYDPDTGERLQTADGMDAIVLAGVTVR